MRIALLALKAVGLFVNVLRDTNIHVSCLVETQLHCKRQQCVRLQTTVTTGKVLPFLLLLSLLSRG